MAEQSSTTIANVSGEHNRAAAELLEQLARLITRRVYSPRIKLLGIDQVCEATGLAQRTIYSLMADGKFPKPQQNLGKNMWRESAIIAWMDANDPNVEKGEA